MGRTDPAGDPTRSLLTIDLDCPWCLNATIEALESDPQVTAVSAHSAAGCLEVIHTGAVDGVLRTIEQHRPHHRGRFQRRGRDGSRHGERRDLLHAPQHTRHHPHHHRSTGPVTTPATRCVRPVLPIRV